MERQRIDKWLFFARVVKSRSLAAALVEAGHVRVNSQRIEVPARQIGIGDVLTIALSARHVRVLKVAGAGQRRGPPGEARTLYEDLAPREAPPAAAPPPECPASPEDLTTDPSVADGRAVGGGEE